MKEQKKFNSTQTIAEQNQTLVKRKQDLEEKQFELKEKYCKERSKADWQEREGAQENCRTMIKLISLLIHSDHS